MSACCRRARRGPVRERVAGTTLVLALAVSACGTGDPITEPATEATTTTPAAGPETAEVAGEPSWSEILDRLSATEQSCIRDVLDEAGLDETGRESAMSRRLFSNDFPTAEDATMFACLAADTADEIFLTSMAAAIEPELGAAVSDAERACLRDWLTGIDLVALVQSTSASADDAAAGLAFLGGMAVCVPDGLISLFLAETGVGFDELDEDERACARELLAEVDWNGRNGLDGSEEDAEAALEALFSLSFGLLACLPDLAEGELAPAPGAFSPGDFSTEGATPVAVGEPVEGALDSADDTEVFVFEAAGGEFYELRVSPGTLEDPTLALYDADGLWLDSDDDSGGSLAPRLYWEASGTGSFYVEVGGYGAGSYTLTITVSDIVDDHSDSPEGATPVAVGEAVGGVLDYADEVDYFVFEAVGGEFYEMTVSPGTLEDPTLALFDADVWQLDYDDDWGGSLAPRLFWEASGTGFFYVEVGGYGAGSYTLTIAVSDIDDDHADSQAGATVAVVGEPVEGLLDYDDDLDFFVFEAVEGELYEMNVSPGTLGDPTLTLYDADSVWLDYDDDAGGSLAPRLYWEASGTGSFYVEVGGYGAGSYTLTITRR